MALWVAAFLGCGQTQGPATVPAEQSTQATVEVARSLFAQGKHQQALQAAQQLLITAPGNLEALRIVSRVYAAESRFAEAADVATQMALGDSIDPVVHWLIAFDWHMRAGDDAACERDLRTAIKIHPNDTRLRRTLGQWLNAQGRRFESQEHVIAMEELGGMAFNEMLSLIDLGGPFQLIDFGNLTQRSSVSLFDLGTARFTYDRGRKIEQTIQQLDRLAASFPDSPAVAAFRGRVLSQLGDQAKLAAWLNTLPKGIEGHPEYWFAVGTLLTLQQRDREAVRSFVEAVRIDPTDRRSLASLAATLDRLGENDQAKKVQETRGTLDQIMRLANNADAEQSMWVAQQLQSFVRPWEAIAWYRHAFEIQGQLEVRNDELDRRREQIRSWQSQGSIDRIRDLRLQAMLGFDGKSFPLPDLEHIPSVASLDNVEATKWKSTPLQFSDVAKSLGVQTTFISGYPKDGIKFYLHQVNGGGIAAFDYDLDGNCDLYLVQSGGNPKKASDSTPNQLYRCLSGDEFAEVSGVTLCNDRSFGQGACVADINQDGFPDLLLANIGSNSLYLNQGDGTFLASHDLMENNIDRWTSSMAVGDVDGDSLPDLVEVNYLDDPAIFESPCNGDQHDCTPQRFRAARDRILINNGDGGLRVWEQASATEIQANFGLGALVTNIDGLAGNDIFVSNDGDLNHYWKSEPADSASSSRYKLVQCAAVSGCSVGRLGYSQACMGVASGDFDHNGFLDLFVTNFYDEPVNLFLQNPSGFFIDEAARYGLVEHSMPLLGFGTQTADFDNDGWLDLAVLNGHLYDARADGVPYRMVSQLFHGHSGGFELQDAKAAGEYWQREQLGRTLATLDFNRDGRMDLIANHLDQPIAVLKNECQASNWLQLELVGVASERSAVGARVTVHAGDKRWSSWRTSGDGYMCSNEPILHFGIGKESQIDKVEIQWPSGFKQVVTAMEINHRFLIVEGEDHIAIRTVALD